MQELLLFVVGLVVGGMNAIAGGGMLVGFPVLLATGMPALIANATSPVIVLPGQLSAALGYRKYLAKIPRRYLVLAVPCSIGAAIGTIILRHTSIADYQKLVPFMILLAVVLFAFQPYLHAKAHRHIHGPKTYRDSWRPLLLMCLAFFPVAVYGGFFGIGVGFVMLAFLGFTSVHEIHRMTALKNLILFSVAVTNLIFLYGAHLIDWRRGLYMAAGTLCGGYLGARGAQKVSSHAIRVAVIIIGFGAAIYLGLRSY